MNYQAYVINLKSATERLRHVQKNLEQRNIPYVRIEGVYGKDLPQPIEGYAEKKYHIYNGKTTNVREVGCYFSHIKALKEFLKTDQPYALILEDDTTLPEEIDTVLKDAAQYGDDWDLLRLTSSRTGKYLVFGQLSGGYEISYNTKVLKSAGAYFINRNAAKRCVEKMIPMILPWDDALDRDWDFGFKTACITPFPIKIEEDMLTQIQLPRAKRIRLYRSTTFHIFHILTHFERIYHRKRYFKDQQRKSS